MKRRSRHMALTRRAVLVLSIGCLMRVTPACGPSLEESENVEVSSVTEGVILPAQFTDARVASVPSPTALVFLPDGALLVSEQSGALRVIRNGTLSATPALNIAGRLCTNSERGLLGVAVDPAFAQNPYVYLYYTFNKYGSCANNQVGTSPVNRVSRFTYDLAIDQVNVASELVILDNVLAIGGNHNGGDLHFGPDGLLYISVGDAGCQLNNAGQCGGGNTNASYTSILSGKMLRITRDGSVPASNPLLGMSGAVRCGAPGSTPNYVLNNQQRCTEIFAWGLRNPFRFAFRPGTSEFFINDVGQNRWEEIDLGQSGANYGWNTREGFCARDSTVDCVAPPSGMTNPIHAYGRSNGCVSITGAAFVPGTAFGPDMNGAYLFGDYGCGTIFKLTSAGGTYSAVPFATSLGSSSVVAMQFGPSANGQSLYYTTYGDGGEVRRIDYTGTANRPPVAQLSASPSTGSVPLNVQFDGRASRDPDAGDTLVYRWMFGDGSSAVTTTTATTQHSYASPATFGATLVVTDNRGSSSNTASVTINAGNSRPVINLQSPAPGSTFYVGQSIQLRASATDAEDGALSDTAFSWTVLKHHDVHTHPFFGPSPGNTSSILTEGPEDLAAATNSYLEIMVTATDSGGLTTTVSRDILPREVNLTFRTVPVGLKLLLNNSDMLTTPDTFTSWERWGLTVSASSQTDASGNRWLFASWSDGGAAKHVVATPAAAATYTANFVAGFRARINFQPAASPVPVGYVADSGAGFGARANGQSYGWNASTHETRDRNAASSADQRYDTLNHMQKPSNPNARWEIALPNGAYDVRVVMGDPNHFDSVFRLDAESAAILSAIPTTGSRWKEASALINVRDGRLTLSNGPGASNNKLCFVDITAR